MTQKRKYHFDSSLKENRYGYLLVTVRHIYKKYLKSDLKSEPLEYNIFREVIEFIFVRIWFYIITELWIFNPPHKFGEWYVAEKISGEGFFRDWQLTRKKGKLVKDYNLHTNGRSYYVKWNKRLGRVINLMGYKFVTYRGEKGKLEGRRGLSAYIKDCSNDPLKKDFRAHII